MICVVLQRAVFGVFCVTGHVDHSPRLNPHIFCCCRPRLEAFGDIRCSKAFVLEERLRNQKSHLRVVRIFTLVPKARSNHLPETLGEEFPHLVAGQEFERRTQCVSYCKTYKAASQAISTTGETHPSWRIFRQLPSDYLVPTSSLQVSVKTWRMKEADFPDQPLDPTLDFARKSGATQYLQSLELLQYSSPITARDVTVKKLHRNAIRLRPTLRTSHRRGWTGQFGQQYGGASGDCK